MGHQSKLKVALLASISFLILGFSCATSGDHAYGNTSGPALVEPGSHGSGYTCSGSFFRSPFTMTAANAGETYGWENRADGGGFFVWPPSQGFSIDASPLSSGTFLSFATVSLNILFCVYTL